MAARGTIILAERTAHVGVAAADIRRAPVAVGLVVDVAVAVHLRVRGMAVGMMRRGRTRVRLRLRAPAIVPALRMRALAAGTWM